MLKYLIVSILLYQGCNTPALATTAHASCTVEQLATAIWHAEGGYKTAWPYGIKHHYRHTSARQACVNTIKHRLRLWNGHGDVIAWIGLTYSPPAINPNWVRLVKYFLMKGQ